MRAVLYPGELVLTRDQQARLLRGDLHRCYKCGKLLRGRRGHGFVTPDGKARACGKCA